MTTTAPSIRVNLAPGVPEQRSADLAEGLAGMREYALNLISEGRRCPHCLAPRYHRPLSAPGLDDVPCPVHRALLIGRTTDPTGHRAFLVEAAGIRILRRKEARAKEAAKAAVPKPTDRERDLALEHVRCGGHPGKRGRRVRGCVLCKSDKADRERQERQEREAERAPTVPWPCPKCYAKGGHPCINYLGKRKPPCPDRLRADPLGWLCPACGVPAGEPCRILPGPRIVGVARPRLYHPERFTPSRPAEPVKDSRQMGLFA